MSAHRVYLDFNATAPLHAAARGAMLGALDVLGNPSAIHAEGRQARQVVETARGQLAAFLNCDQSDLIFTSSATEAAAMCFAPSCKLLGSLIDHSAIQSHHTVSQKLSVDQNGCYDSNLPAMDDIDVIALQSANSETGVIQNTLRIAQQIWATQKEAQNKALIAVDAVQAMGKINLKIDQTGGDYVLIGPHKFGGPKGVGVLYVKPGVTPHPVILGGGQEQGQRSGTENVIGIAGAGGAAQGATEDLRNGRGEELAQLRNWLEEELQAVAPDIVIFGKQADRLPNTSNFAISGWSGELQVMQMDLAGFAISAGSACSSGKIRQSRVIEAMGYDAQTAQSAIRISIGPKTKKKHLSDFVLAWTKAYHNFKAKTT